MKYKDYVDEIEKMNLNAYDKCLLQIAAAFEVGEFNYRILKEEMLFKIQKETSK